MGTYGSIILTNNEEEIRRLLISGVQPIVLADETEEFKYTQFLVASVLLPPYESAEADAMGNIQMADHIYIQYLSRPDIMKVLATLVAAVYSGKNLALYIPRDVSTEFRFGITLIMFMRSTFGIGIGDEVGYIGPDGGPMFSSAPMTDMSPQFEAMRLATMFMFDTIDLPTFAMEFPDGIVPTLDVAAKIVQMDGKDFSRLSQEQLMNYAMRYLAMVKNTISTHRITPVMRVVK